MLSRLIVYALDISHLVLAVEPVGEYERTALFKENARVSVEDGEYFGAFLVGSTTSTACTQRTIRLWLQR